MTLGQFWLWGLSGLGLGSLLMLFVALVWSVAKTIREPKPKFNGAMYSPADLKSGPIKLRDRVDPQGYVRIQKSYPDPADWARFDQGTHETSGETRPGEKGN